MSRLIPLAVSLTLSACAQDVSPGPVDLGPPTFAQLYAEVFEPSCASAACHSGAVGSANLTFDTLDGAYAQLVDAPPTNGPALAAGFSRVAPGDPETSLLLRKLRASSDALTLSGFGARMPLASAQVLAETTLEQVEAWIVAGAPKDGPAGGLDVQWVPAPDSGNYVACDARDEAGLRACLPAESPDALIKRIITPPLVLEPGSEQIMCSFLEVTEDTLLVRKANGMQMDGGHHVGLFVSVVHREVGESVPCDDIDMSSLRFVIGAGGAGGVDTRLKDGLALRVRKGEQLVVQSHYINVAPTSRTVMDAIDLELTTLDDAPVIADSFALIDSAFSVPAGAEGYTRVKECTIDRDIELHMLLGHTHDYGVLFELEVVKQGQPPVLQYHATDGPSLRDNPEVQSYQEPIVLAAGDVLRMTCSWDNPTEDALEWPEEMCVTFMYYTPGDGWMTCDSDDATPQVAGATGAGCQSQGAEGNSLGVGTYCTADGDQCAENGEATFCLAAFSDENNYCSVILCESDAECGEGASCVADGPGSACILDACGD